MSIRIMSNVWRMDLPTTEKMVLLALADAANDDGVTWIAIRSKKAGKLDLLTKCSLSERALQGAIKRLVEAGHLARTEKPGKGVLYQVCPEKTPAADAPRSKCAPQQTTPTPAADAGKPSVTVSSDANASEAPLDADKAFWATAKAYLGGQKAGPLIGRWCRDYGQAETAKAITQAQIDRAVDPVAYVTACLKRQKAAGNSSDPEAFFGGLVV